jgi:hypothetical protein
MMERRLFPAAGAVVAVNQGETIIRCVLLREREEVRPGI